MLDRFWPISLECHRCPVDLFRSLLRRSSSTHSLANASNKGQLRLTGIFWGQPTACKTEETVGISTYLAFPQSSQASSTSASMYAQIWAPLPCASFPANLSSAATILVFRCRAVTDCSTFFPLVELWMSSASPTRHHRHLSSVTVKKRSFCIPLATFGLSRDVPLPVPEFETRWIWGFLATAE